MNRPGTPQRGLTVRAIATWAILFVILGVLGTLVIRPSHNGYADASLPVLTLGVLFELLSWCAIPLVSWLLVFLLQHQLGYVPLMLVALAVALISEVPFDLLNQGSWLSREAQNPVWAILIGLVVLFAYDSMGSLATGVRVGLLVLVCAAATFWIVALALGTRFSVIPLGLAYLTFMLVFRQLWDRENRMIYATGMIGASMLIVPALSAIILHFRQEKPDVPSRADCLKWGAIYPLIQIIGATVALITA